MKKLFCFVLLSLTTILHCVRALEQPMIMRHTDNEINAFVTSQIDSITFSHYDIDSVYCNDIATQIIWTADSIYRIPISEISRVQFQVPENKLRDGVINLEGDLLQYISQCEDDTVLIFSNKTPTHLLPEKGDRLVYDKMTDLLPVGFVGEVLSVDHETDGYKCICTPASLSDIYEYYFGSFVSSTDLPEEDTDSIGRLLHKAPPAVTDRTLTLADINGSVSLSGHLNPWNCEAIDISGGVEAGINLTPKLRIRHTRIVEDRRVWESNLVFVYLDGSTYINLSGQGGIQKKFHVARPGVNLPVAPFLRLEAEGGIALDLSGKIGVEARTEQSLRFVVRTTYDNARLLMPLRLDQFAGVLTHPVFSSKIFGEVEFRIGGYTEIGLAFITGDLAKVSFFQEGGLKITANVPFDINHWSTSDTTTDFYTDLSENSAISIAPYISRGWEGEALKGHLREKEELSVKLFPDLVADVPLFPTIGSANFKYEADDYGKFSASFAGNSIYTPNQWGAKAFLLSDNQETPVYETIHDYDNGLTNPYSTMLGMSKHNSYRVYPALKLAGHTILAKPAVYVPTETEPEEPENPEPEDPIVPGTFDCEVNFTGEFRRYTSIQSGTSIDGAVFSSKTPSVSLSAYGIKADDVERCQWEWRIDHPKLNYDPLFYSYFTQEVNFAGNIVPITIYVPCLEHYNTPIKMYSNKVIEFDDNVFQLRLAVTLKNGKTVYPVESEKAFSYSYRPEMHFENFTCNYGIEGEDGARYNMSVDAKWKGFRAICWDCEADGRHDFTAIYKDDNKYPIAGYTSEILDRIHYQITDGYCFFNNPVNTATVNTGWGWTWYETEFIGFNPSTESLLRDIQKNQPYAKWVVERDELTGKIVNINFSYGLRTYTR